MRANWFTRCLLAVAAGSIFAAPSPRPAAFDAAPAPATAPAPWGAQEAQLRRQRVNIRDIKKRTLDVMPLDAAQRVQITAAYDHVLGQIAFDLAAVHAGGTIAASEFDKLDDMIQVVTDSVMDFAGPEKVQAFNDHWRTPRGGGEQWIGRLGSASDELALDDAAKMKFADAFAEVRAALSTLPEAMPAEPAESKRVKDQIRAIVAKAVQKVDQALSKEERNRLQVLIPGLFPSPNPATRPKTEGASGAP